MKQENDVIIEPKKVREKHKSSLIGIVFIIWFIASIIGLIYFSKINEYYTIMIFGQYFLVFGMIPLFKAEGSDKLISIPFLSIGILGLVIPYLMMHSELLGFEINWESFLAFLGVLIFFLVGAALFITPIIKKNRLKKVCTETVSATIIKHHTYYSDGKTMYCHVYSFKYINKEYKVSDNYYTNVGVKPVGTVVELKINPDNPNEFLDNSSYYFISMTIGFVFLAVSIPVLIYLLTTSNFVE